MKIPIRLNKKELCALYQTSYRTLNKWLSLVPELTEPYFRKNGYCREQLTKIFNHLGVPDEYLEE